MSRKVISKSIKFILGSCMTIWTLHDLWEGYKWMKKNLEVFFREVGPPDAPDVTQPFWFEKWILEKVWNFIKECVTDPRKLADIVKNILKGLYDLLFDHESMKLIAERRKQEWIVYAGTYHSFNNTDNKLIGAYDIRGLGQTRSDRYFNQRNFDATQGYPTYFDPNGEKTNIFKFKN